MEYRQRERAKKLNTEREREREVEYLRRKESERNGLFRGGRRSIKEGGGVKKLESTLED